jgi:membrane-associated phospholipid phosphatase
MQVTIQFPSYHAAGAVLLSYAFAGFPRWIAVPALIVETVLTVSTIPIGDHHLVDVVAGAALAIASIAVARYISPFEPASPTKGVKLLRRFSIQREGG